MFNEIVAIFRDVFGADRLGVSRDGFNETGLGVSD